MLQNIFYLSNYICIKLTRIKYYQSIISEYNAYGTCSLAFLFWMPMRYYQCGINHSDLVSTTYMSQKIQSINNRIWVDDDDGCFFSRWNHRSSIRHGYYCHFFLESLITEKLIGTWRFWKMLLGMSKITETVLKACLLQQRNFRCGCILRKWIETRQRFLNDVYLEEFWEWRKK